MGQCPTFEIVCPTLEVEPIIIFFGYFNAISGNHGGSGTPRNKVCSAANVGEKLIETTVRVCDDGAFDSAETPR